MRRLHKIPSNIQYVGFQIEPQGLEQFLKEQGYEA